MLSEGGNTAVIISTFLPASKSKCVPLAGELPAPVVDPPEGREAGPVEELDVVQDCAAVAGMCQVRQVVLKLWQARVRPAIDLVLYTYAKCHGMQGSFLLK